MTKSFARNCTLAGCLFLFLILSMSSRAQVFPRGNGISLSGIDRFDAYVGISNWTGMSQDRQEFRLNTQRLFEAGLAAAGSPRRVAAKDYLICRVQAAMVGGVVAYSAEIEYWLRNSVGPHYLLWESGDIATAEPAQFNEQLVATECVKYFADEWLKWNPQ
ncbi:MAG: hypothetical protein Q8L60_00570 [Gammaproteobacteria bacterium]|nr:hypothetical protein [Gammaproteobacteria bacterium]MDP2348544.1 hypothetical protein [Gammaproteobacteria bacterium]